MELSKKEKMLLEDQKSHEQLCIEKYGKYAKEAEDEQLQILCEKHEQHERTHLDTLNQILGGEIPQMQQQKQQKQKQQVQPQSKGKSKSKIDKNICSDLLMSEKFVSGAYNTAIFEFRDTNIRQILNHIQKEEQEHGEDLFNYMQSNGMYQMK